MENDMRVVNFETEQGTVAQLVAKKGRKFLHVLMIGFPVHVRRVPLREAAYMTDMDYSLRKAVKVYRMAAEHMGITKEAKNLLNEVAESLRDNEEKGND
jgi:hypothetical protein